MLTSAKIKDIKRLKGLFSETTYVCVLTHQIASFKHTHNEL